MKKRDVVMLLGGMVVGILFTLFVAVLGGWI